MNTVISGVHHVTAITADAQQNIDFYCGVLGLRLVKLTVNFDDPESYHMYYGDELGRPGTIMTFFAWPGAPRGRVGPPQLTAASFAAPAHALDYWADLVRNHQLERTSRFGETVLSFRDPDGIRLEITGSASSSSTSAAGGPIASNYALSGFQGVTISEEGYENTAKLLTELMGYKLEGHEGNRFRYRAAGGQLASTLDLLCVPDARRGSIGAGIVHHVAFRTPDAAQQRAWRDELVQRGFNVSPVMDRTYFQSIYFREPGGVLFEIATDRPGFTVDEPARELGTTLKLPPQYEAYRGRLEKTLPRLRLPGWQSADTSS